MLDQPLVATCQDCGTQVEISPPNLPPSGGALSACDDPVTGWRVESFVCGPCWRARRPYWTCLQCGNGGEEFVSWCRGCGRVQPGLPPYQPDWDLIAKEERERKREHEALVAEATREFPGFPWLPTRGGHL